MTNDTALKQHYDTHGYVVVPSLFNAGEVQLLRNTTDEIIESARGKSESDSIHDLEDSHNPTDTPRVRRIKDPVQQFDTYGTLARNEKLLSILRTLLGTNVRFHSSKINIKSATYGAAVEWHQDWAFYPHTNDDLITVGIYLENCTEENGPLKVLPKSHKMPVYSHHGMKDFIGRIDVKKEKINTKKNVSLTGEAGTVTFHHCRMIHGSGLNQKNNNRPLILFGYRACDAWPIVNDGNPHHDVNFKNYNKNIIFGKKTLTPRFKNVPVIIPLPKREHYVSIYQLQRKK